MIDSNVLIDVLRKRPEALAWFSALTMTQTISGVAALEFLYGARDTAELRNVRKFISNFTLSGPPRKICKEPPNLQH